MSKIKINCTRNGTVYFLFYNDISHKPTVETNIRYNEDTDYVEVFRDNIWNNFSKVGLTETKIITAGVRNLEYTWAGNCTYSYENGQLAFSANSGNNAIYGALVDLTNYDKLEITVKGGYSNYSNCGAYYSVNNGTSPSVGVAIDAAKFNTFILDISKLKGNYYVGAQSYNNAVQTYIIDLILR